MRGICKGERGQELAAELQFNYGTALTIPHRMQANAEVERSLCTLILKQTNVPEFQEKSERYDTPNAKIRHEN